MFLPLKHLIICVLETINVNTVLVFYEDDAYDEISYMPKTYD